MRRKVSLLLFSAPLLLTGPAAFGQAPAPPKSQIEAMKKLDRWVGEWKGSGWASAGPGQRHEFTIVEKVQRKLAGSVLLVEGRGTKKGDKDAEVVVHEALAVVSYDDGAKRYRWEAHDLRGQAIRVEPKLIDGGLEWGFRSGERGVTVRFTIKFDEKRWHEVGEASTDGKTWDRAGEKPVLTAEDPWEKVAVMCPHVVYDAGRKEYRMWYSGGEQYEPNAIGHATSQDGLKWTRHEQNPVFRPDPKNTWEQERVTACQVVKQGDWYVMFYIGFADKDHAQIGLARSRDGIDGWQRHPANPIVRPGKGR